MRTEPAPAWNEHADGDALAIALAGAVAADLRAAIAARGQALLAVSGGSTPRRFLAALGREALDWSRVGVSLVDDRWVAPDEARSNARLLADTLFAGEAGAARWLPLHRPTATPEEALDAVEAALRAEPLPFDALVLGMGNDGHTASLFPDSDHLAEALDPASQRLLFTMRAPNAPEPRITLGLAAILAARARYLHIEGEAKRAVYQDALQPGPVEAMPVRAVLRADAMLQVHWCP